MKKTYLSMVLGAALGLMSCASTGGTADVLNSSTVYVVEASGGA